LAHTCARFGCKAWNHADCWSIYSKWEIFIILFIFAKSQPLDCFCYLTEWQKQKSICTGCVRGNFLYQWIYFSLSLWTLAITRMHSLTCKSTCGIFNRFICIACTFVVVALICHGVTILSYTLHLSIYLVLPPSLYISTILLETKGVYI